jgi:DNA invertase Pin-like site-specific DNA recombinase
MRGLRIDRWYEETESSAKTRPVLSQLLKDLRGGAFVRVFVYRLDRLTRNGIRDTLKIVQEIQASGAALETVADSFRIGPESELVLAVLAWAAQMERAAIAERIASARARIEAEGGSWGRPRRVADKTIERIKTMKKTQSIRSIAVALKIPRATISDVLSEKGAYVSGRQKPKKLGKKTVQAHPNK